jgi:hypothetical protein
MMYFGVVPPQAPRPFPIACALPRLPMGSTDSHGWTLQTTEHSWSVRPQDAQRALAISRGPGDRDRLAGSLSKRLHVDEQGITRRAVELIIGRPPVHRPGALGLSKE